MQTLTVLGATGTVGRNTLDVVRRHPTRLGIHALTANKDADGLLALCLEFRPALAVLADATAAAVLEKKLKSAGSATRVASGDAAVVQAAADSASSLVMSAMVGAAGLMPTLAAVRVGKRVLIANKEPLVMAGRLLMGEARRAQATIIPIDSEHNAIFQCLSGQSAPERAIARLILTASGGPFRDWPIERLSQATPEQAVRHPNWVMGPKISVDSATMMNKGLELIEAKRLFGIGENRLEVVLHPESIVHSMVEFTDGSTLAQLGQPDMRVPIAHALAWPERWESGVGGLDWPQVGPFNFRAVEADKFPCLGLARQALRAEGVMPNVLNAANEIAVQGFLDKRLPFTGIAERIADTLDAAAAAGLPAGDTLDDILAVDRWARQSVREQLEAAHV